MPNQLLRRKISEKLFNFASFQIYALKSLGYSLPRLFIICFKKNLVYISSPLKGVFLLNSRGFYKLPGRIRSSLKSLLSLNEKILNFMHALYILLFRLDYSMLGESCFLCDKKEVYSYHTGAPLELKP